MKIKVSDDLQKIEIVSDHGILVDKVDGVYWKGEFYSAISALDSLPYMKEHKESVRMLFKDAVDNGLV